MEKSLKEKTVFAFIWSLVEKGGRKLGAVVISIILAQYISPAEFGLLGMLAIFTQMANIFVNFGFATAIVREQNISQNVLSSIFYVNIFMGAFFTFLLYIGAQSIADFYEKNELFEIVHFLSFTIFITSLGVIQSTLLRKELLFKQQAKISLIALGMSGLVSITLAIKGFGVWSIVYANIASVVTSTLLFWSIGRWRPRLGFDFREIKGMINFSYKIFIANLLDAFFLNIHNVIIGKYFTPTDVGLYQRATTFQKIPLQLSTESLQTVLFPTLSKLQDDEVKLRQSYKKVLQISTYISAALMLILLLSASSLVKVLLPEVWWPLIAYLEVLTLGGIIYPMHGILSNILVIKGYSGQFLQLEVMKKGLIVIGIVAGFPWGVYGIVVASVIVMYLSMLLNAYMSGRHVALSVIEILKDQLPMFVINAITALIVYGLVFVLEDGLMKILFILISYVLVYIVFSYLFKPMAYRELKIILQHILLKRKSKQ